MATFHCDIPDALNGYLGATNSLWRVSKSVVVREALEAKLQLKRLALVLAFDLMNEGCGVVQVSPTDDCWKRKHFPGGGRDCPLDPSCRPVGRFPSGGDEFNS